MSEKTPNVPPKDPLINTSKNLNKFQRGEIQRSAPSHIIIKRQDKKKNLEKRKKNNSLIPVDCVQSTRSPFSAKMAAGGGSYTECVDGWEGNWIEEEKPFPILPHQIGGRTRGRKARAPQKSKWHRGGARPKGLSV